MVDEVLGFSSVNRFTMRVFILLVALCLKTSLASSCLNDTQVTAIEEDKLDLAISKISQIMKETCSCPMYLRPIDCEEVLKNGHSSSGVYTIWPKRPPSGCDSLQVYCDMETDGGGWIVIQRRGDNVTPDNFFDQDWETYKKGFGDFTKEFWLDMKRLVLNMQRTSCDYASSRKRNQPLPYEIPIYWPSSRDILRHTGNEYIHAITSQGKYSARFDLRNMKGEEKYALYKDFAIGDENSKYKLVLGGYTGTAGAAITNHNQRSFYTKDRPNPPPSFPNYRKVPNSGWWFNVFPSSNLNGLKKTSGKDGIVWYTFGGYSPPLVFSEIKLRAAR